MMIEPAENTAMANELDQIRKVQSVKYAYWFPKKEYELVKSNFRFFIKASKKGIKKRRERYRGKDATSKFIILSLIITLSMRLSIRHGETSLRLKIELYD